jgi:transposase
MSHTACLERIGVGIDTARYGHRVWFLRPDRRPAAAPLTVMENHTDYENLRQRLNQLHQQHPQACFYVHIDAAGQYAANLEHFLRNLDLPINLSIGEPVRNKNYRRAHFPKRTTDDTESHAMARFAVVEQPEATPVPSTLMPLLREIASRLQAQVRQTTRTINQLHNILARTFPELAQLTDDISSGWVLRLLALYPTAERIAAAHVTSLEKIPHVLAERALALQQAALKSVASVRGHTAEILVRNLVAEVRHCQKAERKLRELLASTFDELPASPQRQVPTIPGIGYTTAALLVAKVGNIDRFATPNKLVSYFGVFPEEHSSGVDKNGNPLPQPTMSMSRKGNDLVRAHLWTCAMTAIRLNPAVRALYRRLRAKGKRGDVAIGHCMRKLLHLVFAVWKTDRPFDPKHFPWETPKITDPATDRGFSANKKAVGHKQDAPAKKVVTTAVSTMARNPEPVNAATPTQQSMRRMVDYAFVRQQVTMEQVLNRLGLLDRLRGRGLQRRGPCPVHGLPGASKPTFSVHLGKQAFQCFHAKCEAKGNALDLWAAVHRLPLYEAALDFCKTFQIAANREENP